MHSPVVENIFILIGLEGISCSVVIAVTVYAGVTEGLTCMLVFDTSVITFVLVTGPGVLCGESLDILLIELV